MLPGRSPHSFPKCVPRFSHANCSTPDERASRTSGFRYEPSGFPTSMIGLCQEANTPSETLGRSADELIALTNAKDVKRRRHWNSLVHKEGSQPAYQCEATFPVQLSPSADSSRADYVGRVVGVHTPTWRPIHAFRRDENQQFSVELLEVVALRALLASDVLPSHCQGRYRA